MLFTLMSGEGSERLEGAELGLCRSDKSESSPNLCLKLRVAQKKSSLLYNHTVWKCARNFGWKVSERMYELKL